MMAGSKDAPQCILADQKGGGDAAADEDGIDVVVLGAGADTMLANQFNRLEIAANENDASLSSLSDDILFDILLLCGPTDVEDNLKLVNHRFHTCTSLSSLLWKEFCVSTGKAIDARFVTDEASKSNNFASLLPKDVFEEKVVNGIVGGVDENLYRSYYFRNPCVPVDFLSINDALQYCTRTPSSLMQLLGDKDTFYSSIGSAVLLPGEYHENICIGGETWAVGEACDKAVNIRAAFPDAGATIVSPATAEKDTPVICISTCDEETIEGKQKQISVRLSHLKIVHSSLGADIWSGNAVIVVDGPRCQVVIDSCVLSSESGRGLVCTNQSVTEVYRSSIIDCAATGFYLGDWGSRAKLSGCNVVRNGFGSRREEVAARVADGGLQMREQFEAVPSGHSGAYVESSMCWIEDSLLAGNCLTGLSVVRGGFVSLSACDVTENGHSRPIMIEDQHDVFNQSTLQGLQGATIRGGVVEGPIKNNYNPTYHQSNGEHDKVVFKGGMWRGISDIQTQILHNTRR